MSSPDAEDASPSPEHSGDEDENDMAEDSKFHSSEKDVSPSQTSNGHKPASNAKDPQRPRRKKARRACLACQRAHLTCGDERPCHRCIKRGLQDACQDGVRKKAKYLHDAPTEALMPGVGGHYPTRHLNGGPVSLPHGINTGLPMHHQGNYHYQQAQTQPGNYGMYHPNPNESHMPPQPQEAQVMATYSNQHTPVSPPYTQQGSQQTPPVQHQIPGVPPVSQPNQQMQQQYGGPLFDPSDPALFNFDISNLNFGSHYGAIEFGMLGHIASGAADTPPQDANQMNPMNQAATLYNPSGHTAQAYSDGQGGVHAMAFQQDAVSEWQHPHSRQGSVTHIQTPHNTPMSSNMEHIRQDIPNAYAIGARAGSVSSASPASTGHEAPSRTLDSSTGPAYFVNTNQQPAHHQPIYPNQQQGQQHTANLALQPANNSVINRKRRRDTRAIYEDIKQKYPYPAAFHRLQKLLNSRLPRSKVLRIAKAMAAYRPTFISCMRDLDDQDLIAQEQTFQRKLWSYMEWLEYQGTPTIVIRRSGEIAAVGKEFCILSDWRKDVLLGKEPNLNVNWDSSPDAPSGTTSRATQGTPRGVLHEEQSNAPQPVFLAELLDADSVVQFYEDFARLAFFDARGSVQRRCKIMRYQSKLEDDSNADDPQGNMMREEGNRKKQKTHHIKHERHEDNSSLRPGQRQDMGRVGGSTVDCQMCWCVWHDQFDMPSMIVMNFLPILQASSPTPETRRTQPTPAHAR